MKNKKSKAKPTSTQPEKTIEKKEHNNLEIISPTSNKLFSYEILTLIFFCGIIVIFCGVFDVQGIRKILYAYSMKK